MNFSWCILHRTVVGIYDPSKNMAALTKTRTYASDSSFSQISPKPSGLANTYIIFYQLYKALLEIKVLLSAIGSNWT